MCATWFLIRAGPAVNAIAAGAALISAILFALSLWWGAKRRHEDVVQQNLFQLLPLIREALPEREVERFRADHESFLKAHAELCDKTKLFTIIPQEDSAFLRLLSESFVKVVPQNDKFRRTDLFLAFETVRKQARPKQIIILFFWTNL